MSWQAGVIKLTELDSAEDPKPVLRRRRFLLEFLLLAKSLLFFFLLLFGDLCLALLEEHLTILILPEGWLTLGAVFKAHTKVG